MFCVIYRSTKREQTYLYVEKDDFSRVPEELMKALARRRWRCCCRWMGEKAG
jgi:uncharacterized protein YcgL (UPF0745 family)